MVMTDQRSTTAPTAISNDQVILYGTLGITQPQGITLKTCNFRNGKMTPTTKQKLENRRISIDGVGVNRRLNVM